MTTWVATDLSVSPPNFQLADTDRETFAFDANQTVTTATSVLTKLGSLTDASALIEATSVAGEIVSVTVAGLTRGETYELAVTFTNSSNRKWTRTLVLECVA